MILVLFQLALVRPKKANLSVADGLTFDTHPLPIRRMGEDDGWARAAFAVFAQRNHQAQFRSLIKGGRGPVSEAQPLKRAGLEAGIAIQLTLFREMLAASSASVGELRRFVFPDRHSCRS